MVFYLQYFSPLTLLVLKKKIFFCLIFPYHFPSLCVCWDRLTEKYFLPPDFYSRFSVGVEMADSEIFSHTQTQTDVSGIGNIK